MLSKLQYISQGDTDPFSHLRNIREVLDAGVKLVQLRLKNVSMETYVEIGEMAQELCRKRGADLIINDQPAVAQRVDAAAIHLGLEDMDIAQARSKVPGKLIGGTANTFEQVAQRCAEGVDYIGLGPYRFTNTKEKLSPVLGLHGYMAIVERMKQEQLHTPIYAIGGIQLGDIAALIGAGVYGIAVSGLLTQSPDKKNLIKEIHKILDHA